MNIQLIATDLDGTLLADDHRTVPPRSREALRLAAEHGVLTAIASGRTTGILLPVFRQVPQIRYAVISNGAAAVDLQTGERIFSKPFPEQKLNRILEILEEFPHVVLEIYADGESWVPERNEPELQERAKENPFWLDFAPATHLVPDMKEALKGREVEKITVGGMRPGEKKQLLDAMDAASSLGVSSAIENYMELNEKGVNKGEGLSRLCARLGIPQAAVMALGDGDNDFEMMDWAGVSVAMRNGLPQTKEHARYESRLTNDEGGVGEAIEQFVLRPAGLHAVRCGGGLK